ncbi:MAG: DUF5009 domain-containing protein [Bryobacteraceae bacterium]|nr:DUF5009 domain-containing protein [Bryobacteraceae bacterium]
MIVVNTPGTHQAIYPPLRHAQWHGWTLTDVVFPSFVWIVGLAITLSLGRKLTPGVPRLPFLTTALRRAAILFALGLFIYAFPAFDAGAFRILGVLQRIAICFLATVALFLVTGIRGQIAATAACLAIYSALMLPGGFERESNFAHAVDRMVLGTHNYSETKTWDPEGIVSTLTALATCLLGLLAGHLLALKKDLATRCTWMLITGAALVAAAYGVEPWIPINKQLWTTSFTLLMAGIDFVLFATILWLADGEGYRWGTRPFVILGQNAIAIYLSSELIDITLRAIPMGGLTLRDWLYQSAFAPLAAPLNASLLYSVSYLLLNLAIAYLLHRRGWLLRV